MTFLQVENLETFYGTSQALFDVNLTLREGEALALMGRNGMGKTTTIRSICGMSAPKRGTISFDGKAISGLPSYKIARLGLGLVPEGRRCFPNLTVEENLLASATKGDWTLKQIYKLFDRLGERAKQSAHSLSGGEQQMLAIGRALMTNPKLLILDEATEGLAPVIRKDIWSSIRILKATGMSLIVVDKSLAELMPIVDDCVVLENGRTAWTGKPPELTPELQGRYLGLD